MPIHCRVVKDLNEFDGSWTVRCLVFHLYCLRSDICYADVGKYDFIFLICCIGTKQYFHVAGMMDDISLKVLPFLLCSAIPTDAELKIYDALAYHVTQATMNRQRMKTVSLWSLQMTASAILAALRNTVDPVSLHFKEAYLNGRAVYDAAYMGPTI